MHLRRRVPAEQAAGAETLTTDSGRLALSTKEAAASAGISRTRLYQALSDGELASLKIGRRRLVRVETLAAWLKHLEGRG